MLIIIEKIISSFLTLPGIFLLLNIIIFIFIIKTSWSKLLKIISILTIVLMIVTFTGIGILFLVIPLENFAGQISDHQNSFSKEIPTVVLGGGINYGVDGIENELSSISKNRLLKGIFIVKQNNSPLIYTGGVAVGYSTTSEADLAEKFVNRFDDIEFILESKAQNTYQNGLEIKKWLKENRYDQIYLVTSAIHMKRAAGVFEKLDINFIPVVSNYSYSHKLSWLDYLPNRGSLRANMQAVHEWIGLIWYKINSRI